MLYFECDYNNGAHPQILQRLIETNDILQSGYGADSYTAGAKNKIRNAIGKPDADIYFIAGGTQTNLVVISSILKGFEGVIAADTGHIGSHEAGAIEYTGHKVLTLPSHEGRISADELEEYISAFYSDGNYEHMVFPGLVYVSFPTELGTLYSKSELSRIYAVCKDHGIKLFIDGARLGYGLMSTRCDFGIEDISKLCDVFYIGGTKVGALCGEAVVFPNNDAPEHFFTSVKQHGALLAKGRLCGIQFDTLFTDNLYLDISKNAIVQAEKLKDILKEKGYKFYLETPTNQQFIVIDNTALDLLRSKVAVSFWEKYDGTHTVIRFCTSWATTDEQIEQLRKIL